MSYVLDKPTNIYLGGLTGPMDVDQWRWHKEDPSLNSTPTAADHFNSVETSLFEAVIPYIKGVSFKVYAEVLEDEADLVSGVRVALRRAALEAKDAGKDVAVAIDDLARPSVDLLQRRLTRLAFWRLKSGALHIAFAAISFASVVKFGAAAGVWGLAPFAPAFTFSVEHLRARRERQDIVDDPMYLMWRLSQARRS